MVLPEVTLAGPVELVFSRITDLSLYLPHSTDVPRARRLLVAPGAALTLRQLKGISLRKPVDLPDLPASYITEVRVLRVLRFLRVCSSRELEVLGFRRATGATGPEVETAADAG
jgi:hypothetical protein